MYIRAEQLTCDKKGKPFLKWIDWDTEEGCFINGSVERGWKSSFTPGARIIFAFES